MAGGVKKEGAAPATWQIREARRFGSPMYSGAVVSRSTASLISYSYFLGAVFFMASFASFCCALILASRRLVDALPRALSDSIT